MYVNMTLLTAQSLTNKEMVLNDYLLQHNKEICMVTETWKRSSDSDKICRDASELSKMDIRLMQQIYYITLDT